MRLLILGIVSPMIGRQLAAPCRKFRANIKIKGRKIALGAYDEEIEAAKVRLTTRVLPT